MTKPIEEGCVAKLVNCAEAGMIVQVGKFLGSMPNFMYTNLWIIDEPVVYDVVGKERVQMNYIDAQFLVRLDNDNDGPLLAEWKDCDWQPKDITVKPTQEEA